MKQYIVTPASEADDQLLQQLIAEGRLFVTQEGKETYVLPPTENQVSPEEQTRIGEVLKKVWGSITPERAKEINEEIYRMRDEEWD